MNKILDFAAELRCPACGKGPLQYGVISYPNEPGENGKNSRQAHYTHCKTLREAERLRRHTVLHLTCTNQRCGHRVDLNMRVQQLFRILDKSPYPPAEALFRLGTAESTGTQRQFWKFAIQWTLESDTDPKTALRRAGPDRPGQENQVRKTKTGKTG